MELVTVQEAAAVLGVTDERVRQMRRAGELTAAVTLTGPRYLFLTADVERLRIDRTLLPPLKRPRPGAVRVWALKRAAKGRGAVAA